MTKTNVMRLLEVAGVAYRPLEYEFSESEMGGENAARAIGLPPEQVFKTLVTRGPKNDFVVFCIPVCSELDLKKAARASGEKSIELIHMKELLGITGYIRGGCSPLGMKKQFPTFFDETACLYEEIAVSAGKRGFQVAVSPDSLLRAAGGRYADLTA